MEVVSGFIPQSFGFSSEKIKVEALHQTGRQTIFSEDLKDPILTSRCDERCWCEN